MEKYNMAIATTFAHAHALMKFNGSAQGKRIKHIKYNKYNKNKRKNTFTLQMPNYSNNDRSAYVLLACNLPPCQATLE